MKKTIYILTSILISISLLTIGCKSSKHANSIKDYKYAFVHSIWAKNKSIISLYDKNGIFLYDKEIPYGAITGSAFKKYPDETNNKIYYASPEIGTKITDYIPEIDKNTLDVKKINIFEGSPAYFFDVDKNYIYAGMTSIDDFDLYKTDIKENKVIKKTTLQNKGTAFSITTYKDKLYLITTDLREPYSSTLNILNSDNLNIEKSLPIGKGGSSMVTAILNNDLYVLNSTDEKGNPSNILVKINLRDYSVEHIELPFENLDNICVYKNNLYIPEYNSVEPLEGKLANNRIVMYDTKNGELKTIYSKNAQQFSYIKDDVYISSDGQKMYFYSLDNFELKNSFNLVHENPDIDSMYPVGFFIK